MSWSGGVYTRGYPSWSNDAASNLPISSAKFDVEDNDFAGGLNNCLTKDGLNVPTGILAWSATASPVANFSRGSDGSVFNLARTGGSNNPVLQFQNADASGFALNVVGGGISLSVGGVGVLSVLSTKELQINAISGNRALDILTAAYAFGNSTDNPSFTFIGTGAFAAAGVASLGNLNVTLSTVPANGLCLIGANQLALSTNTVSRLSINQNGNVVFQAPTATGSSAVTVNGIATNNAMLIQSGLTASGGFGLSIRAGTNASDYSLNIFESTGATLLLRQLGTGECFIIEPSTSSAIPSGTHQVGYLDTPLNTQAANYQLVLTDRGKMIDMSTANSVTIPANSGTAFPLGTTILVSNRSGSAITVNITTDTLTFLPAGTTGARTLANLGVMTLWKLTATSWRCWGFGIT